MNVLKMISKANWGNTQFSLSLFLSLPSSFFIFLQLIRYRHWYTLYLNWYSLQDTRWTFCIIYNMECCIEIYVCVRLRSVYVLYECFISIKKQKSRKKITATTYIATMCSANIQSRFVNAFKPAEDLRSCM